MRKKALILFVAIMTGMMSLSCTKFLQEEPKTFLASDNYYTSEQQLESAANGLYGGLGLMEERGIVSCSSISVVLFIFILFFAKIVQVERRTKRILFFFYSETRPILFKDSARRVKMQIYLQFSEPPPILFSLISG